MFPHAPYGPIGLPNPAHEGHTEPARSTGRRLSAIMLSPLTRRILHCNLTAHPTAEWTLQQFREAIPCDHPYRFLIRDRDSIFSAEVDDQLKAFGLRVLRTPAWAPQANAFCERLVGRYVVTARKNFGYSLAIKPVLRKTSTS
jgi:hypothetical protein